MAKSRAVVYGAVIVTVNVFFQSLVHVSAQELVLSLHIASKPPYYQGQLLTYQSLVKHKPSSTETAENVTVDWTLPSFLSYKTHQSQAGAKLPNDVTSNVNQIKMKFGSISPSEKIDILINVTIDPSDTFRDNRFHYATIRTTLKYRWPDPCVTATLSHRVLHFPFFCSECSSFGSLGIENGDIKDSQIQASSFLPYQQNINTWVPITSFLLFNIRQQMKLNFYQVDLKFPRELIMVVIDGIPKDDPIPWNIVQLSFSENSWKWKMLASIYEREFFPGNDDILLAIATLKPITTRYLRINSPPFGLSNIAPIVYKVELYACNVNIGSVNSEKGPLLVGIESSSFVPDSRFSSPSSLDLQHKPHLGRLNTKVDGGSWCASTCNPLNYLQIDLGDTWKISEIKNQGRHTTNNTVIAVKTYSISSSLDGGFWTPYTINGGTKIFWGNDIPNLATRHRLSKPLTAKYVRFEPRTCIQNACMRVELYGTKASSLENKDPLVVFGRSMLLDKSTGAIFVCNSEVAKDKSHCFVSKNHGNSWQAISFQVLNVLAFDPNEKRLYGLSKNGRSYLKSEDTDGLKWHGISHKQWYTTRDRASVITAEEIPFVPISRNVTNTIEPLVQMTTLNGSQWQADQLGVYFKPNGGTIKMVLSFLPYSYDLSSNPCYSGVCVFGKCELLGSLQYKCHCMPGYTGAYCDTVIYDYCAGNQSLCQNGGTCTPILNSFQCTCTADYTGTFCQFAPCLPNPCKNGGTCSINSDGGFTCACDVYHSGTICANGNFVMVRGARSSSAVWSYSSGKFDKIVFFSNSNLTLFGICISDTFSSRDTPCSYKTRVRKEGSTNILASTSGTANCKIDNIFLKCPQFTNPLQILAGTRFIIEVIMSSSKNIRKLVNGVSTRTVNLTDGSLSVTYSYETVSAVELADSNGSTQSEGGIIGLSAQFAHD